MNRAVDAGKTLLVDGPASVTVALGKVEVFGSVVASNTKIVIREGKRLPFTTKEKATVEISLGENARVEEVDGNTIPPSWIRSCEELMNLTSPAIAIVLGTVDSGKTSFCTYLINKLLHEKRKVAILDGDLGQSDIGPPCTVAYTFVTKPATDLFDLKAQNAFFVGITSPSGAIEKVIEELSALRKEILNNTPDFVIINTDGWVEGEEAVKYKIQLVETLAPDLIFCIQQKEELAPLLSAFEKSKKVVANSPPTISQRSRDKRRSLRELGYMKYLKNARARSFSLGWLRIEDYGLLGLGKEHGENKQARKICELLRIKPLHFVELKDRVCIVVGREPWLTADDAKRAEQFANKKVVIMRKGEEEGLLVGLYDSVKRFLGVGVLQEIDYFRKTLRIFTPVSGEVSMITVGRVRLDNNLKEIPTFAEERPFNSHSL